MSTPPKNTEKATAAIEDIFSHAVALSQANRLKNTVYCLGKEVFVLNFDNTILLKFTVPEWTKPFQHPISFNANDYDSNTFYEEDGKIVFVSEVGGVCRKKSISTPGATPEEIAAMYNRYQTESEVELSFHRNITEALSEKLSHIEIAVIDGAWKLTQRDIYSGSTIELTEIQKGLRAGKKIAGEVKPIAIRTNDFLALFAFQERVTFHFSSKGKEYALVTGAKYDMEGVIAFCVYDELGEITTAQPAAVNAAPPGTVQEVVRQTPPASASRGSRRDGNVTERSQTTQAEVAPEPGAGRRRRASR